MSKEDTHMTDAEDTAAREVRVVRGCVDGQPLGSLPNFGTVDTNESLRPTVNCASTLEQLFEEFKMYRKLRK